MHKRMAFIALIVIVLAFSFASVSLAADTKAAAPIASVQKAKANAPAMPKPNFGMLSGTITAIDTGDPANVKISIKSDADNSARTITVTPWTNITKVTDVSELKTGETVRMMTRKVDNKDVAMGIMFGKVRTMPAPPPAAAPVAVKK